MTSTSARTATTRFEELAALRGDLIMPGEPGYDEATSTTRP